MSDLENIKSTITRRCYDYPSKPGNPDNKDFMEVVADYEHEFMAKGISETTSGGVTISIYGSGQVWIDWESLPELITMLQMALKEKP